MKKMHLSILAAFTFAAISVGGFAQTMTQADFTPVILPQYMSSGTATRLPVIYRATVSNLTANTTYRYYTNAAQTADIGTTNSGAGNPLFANTSGNFTYSTSASTVTAGAYATFTTDATGSYTGWFGVVNSGNARFTAGNDLYMSIVIGDNSAGTVLKRLVFPVGSTVRVLAFSTTASGTNATALKGSSVYNAKDIVFLYDNTTGAGRPLTSAPVESIGVAIGSVPAFYSTVAGTFNEIIPNDLANGIRRVEERSLITGNIVGAVTDADGAWGSGANTVNPVGGTTSVINLTTTDSAIPVTVSINPLTTTNTTPTLTGNVSDAAATISITVGSQTFAATNLGSTWTAAVPSVLADGTYNVFVTATDLASNVGTDATTSDLVIDTTGPTGTISAITTPRTTSAGVVTINFNENVTGVDISDFALTQDISTVTLTAGMLTQVTPSQYTVDLTSVTAADALYVFSLRPSGTGIIDGLGNPKTTGSSFAIFRVDTTAPVSSVTLADTSVVGTSIVLPVTSTDTGGSGVSSTALFVKVNGGGIVNSGLTASGGNFTYTAAVDGIYEFYTVATDAAGNVEAAPAVSADVIATVNTVANSTFAADYTVAQTNARFPMESNLDVVAFFTPVTAPGTLTVSRSAPRTAPPVGLIAGSLADQSWTIAATGGLAGTGTIIFGYDETKLGTLAEGDLNAVFSVDGSVITPHTGASVTVDTGLNTVTVSGVTAFSEWYIGNASAGISDWALMSE